MNRFLLRSLVSILVLPLVWAAGFLWFVGQVPSMMTEDATVTDAVIVLTGGEGRLEHGLKRIKEGAARKIFISGVNDEATADHIIQRAIAREAPNVVRSDSETLTLGHQAANTIGNAEEVAHWISGEQVRSIRLVTANYHMPRSILEFRYTLPVGVRIIPDPAMPESFHRQDWWRDKISRDLLLSEYHKYLAAAARHVLITWNKGWGNT